MPLFLHAEGGEGVVVDEGAEALTGQSTQVESPSPAAGENQSRLNPAARRRRLDDHIARDLAAVDRLNADPAPFLKLGQAGGHSLGRWFDSVYRAVVAPWR